MRFGQNGGQINNSQKGQKVDKLITLRYIHIYMCVCCKAKICPIFGLLCFRSKSKGATMFANVKNYGVFVSLVLLFVGVFWGIVFGGFWGAKNWVNEWATPVKPCCPTQTLSGHDDLLFVIQCFQKRGAYVAQHRLPVIGRIQAPHFWTHLFPIFQAFLSLTLEASSRNPCF